jgi:alkylation response protein AidB-like acyl-CoA dehydrogenase
VTSVFRTLGPNPSELYAKIPMIFEGTPEIQQLVIARAISGLRIE